MSALVTLSTHPHTRVQIVTPAAWPGIGGADFLSEQQKCLPLISVQRHWQNPFVYIVYAEKYAEKQMGAGTCADKCKCV